jgi:leucine-rich repeat protein SHOC2
MSSLPEVNSSDTDFPSSEVDEERGVIQEGSNVLDTNIVNEDGVADTSGENGDSHDAGPNTNSSEKNNNPTGSTSEDGGDNFGVTGGGDEDANDGEIIFDFTDDKDFGGNLHRNNAVEDEIERLETELGLGDSPKKSSPKSIDVEPVNERNPGISSNDSFNKSGSFDKKDKTGKTDEFATDRTLSAIQIIDPVSGFTYAPGGNDDDIDPQDMEDMEDYGGTGASKEKINLREMQRQFSEMQIQAGGPNSLKRLRKYPRDCYSMIALYGPTKLGRPSQNNWPNSSRYLFFFGISIFFIQTFFFALLIYSVVNIARGSSEENDNPDVEEAEGFVQMIATFIPSNSSSVVKMTQFLSLLVYVVFPGDSVMDLVKAFQHMPKRNTDSKDAAPVRCMTLSCVLRGIAGGCAVTAALILVMTSRTVIDIILNFTALNSISSIDDMAFGLCEDGVFGPEFEDASEKIKRKMIPLWAHRKTTHVVYWKVMACIGVVFLGAFAFVMAAQQSTTLWITRTFRVQFQEPAFKEFSGCYRINPSLENAFNRRGYTNVEKFGSYDLNTTFQYCRSERQWLFYEDEGQDACEVYGNEIVHSLKTNDHDISPSFDSQWFFPISNSPFELFFFETLDENELNCDLSLEDGRCDDPFNEHGYNYDEGDCCASTCTGFSCGIGGLTSVFGDISESGDGYQNCKHPRMEAITIRIDDMQSSRQDMEIEPLWFLENYFDETEFRSFPPVPPLLDLICDEKQVLQVSIKPSMLNNSQTVMVEDGASCTLKVKNKTVINPWLDWGVDASSPIWFVDYTVFHGDANDMKNDEIEMFTRRSRDDSDLDFNRIPNCFFKKLGQHVDKTSIYTGSDSTNEAIRWLLEDTSDNSACEVEPFIERYALISMLLDMKGSNTSQITNLNQCDWQNINCFRGKMTFLDFRMEGLYGRLPTEIGLLTDLDTLIIEENNITSIPTEIGLLTDMTEISIGYNEIVSVPTEIGLLTSMTALNLGDNYDLVIPDEIGMLTKLTHLGLEINSNTYIPTSFGYLTNLQNLYLPGNYITALPTEIGLMTSLKKFQMDWNFLTSVPTEIGLLTNLWVMSFSAQEILAIPTEIGLLTKLAMLQYRENNLTAIPTEIGHLTNLDFISIMYNEITSIPSEIGLLTKLTSARLSDNNFTTIPDEFFTLTKLNDLELEGLPEIGFPTEIWLLSNLEKLRVGRNDISTNIGSEIGLLTNLRDLILSENNISALPTEIGILSNLLALELGENNITKLPSEIGLLSNLEYFDVTGNNLSIDSIPAEVEELCSSHTIYCDLGLDASGAETEFPTSGAETEPPLP